MDVDVRGLGHMDAHLDLLNPTVLHGLLDQDPLLRSGLQHTPQQGSTRTRGEVVDGLWAFGGGRVLGLRGVDVGRVELFRHLGDAPRELLEVEAVVDDPACPDVH